jgi:hypothetical protein
MTSVLPAGQINTPGGVIAVDLELTTGEMKQLDKS